MPTDCETNDLEQLRRTISQLREENALLRKAAETFGALADRLNLALQRDARSARRGGSRDASTRRTQRAL
jgi:hypothetical protein